MAISQFFIRSGFWNVAGRYPRRPAAKYRRALTGLAPLVWTPEEAAEWRNVPNAFITTAL